jgi:glutathione S-transferase
MPLPEIIGSMRSSYTRAVCMLCEERAIEYTLRECLLAAPELHAIHPFGKMPVLRHADFTLFESKAIATYLDRHFPGPCLLPSDARLGALSEQWISFVNSEVYAAFRAYLLACLKPATVDGSPDPVASQAARAVLRKQFVVLDKAVAATGHLVGDQISFADLNLLTILHNVRLLPAGTTLLTATASLASYYGRHSARASYRNTIPPPGPPDRHQPLTAGRDTDGT